MKLHVNGNFGDVIISGGGALGLDDGTDNLQIGAITAGGTLGGSSTGTISITEDTSDVELVAAGFDVAIGGTLGAVTFTGPGTGTTDVDLLLTGNIGTTATGATGDVTASGFQNITTAATGLIAGSAIGNVSLSTNPGDTNTASLILIDGFIDSDGDLGNIVLNAGPSSSAVDINNGIIADGGTPAAGSGTVGTVDITGATISLDSTTANVLLAGTVGDINATGNTTINDNLTVATFGNLTFDGNLVFDTDNGIRSSTALGDLTVTGTTAFDTDTTGSENIIVADTGTLTFSGDVDFGTTSTKTSIIADDDTSSPDVIGGLSFGGLVIGQGGTIDIQASSIGDISFSASLNQAERLVTNLGIQAVNNGDGVEADAEAVSRDGSNLSDYTIGNISVTSTNTIGIADTFLFAGDTYIQSLGSIGDISLTAGGSPAVQTGLFAAITDELNIKNASGNPFVTEDSMVDFDGNGAFSSVTHTTADTALVAADEDDAIFTGGTVSIGNITINTGASVATDLDSILFGGTGLTILSGVDALPGIAAFDGDTDAYAAAAATSAAPTAVALTGTIGDVLVINSSQQLTTTAHTGGGVDFTDHTGATASGIFAYGLTGDVFGTVQGVDQSAALTVAGNEGLILGDETTTALKPGDNEILVFRV